MANLSAKDKWLDRLGEALRDGSFVKITLSGYRGNDSALKNVSIRPVELRGEAHLSFVYRYASRDVTKNLPPDEGAALVADLIGTQFRHANLFSTRWTSELEFREGRPARLLERKPEHSQPASTAHDRAKVRSVGAADAPWLCGLGVSDATGKVAKGMEAKFRQINKFVEVLESFIAKPGRNGGSFTAVDMGCGKGYLTFATYDFLRRLGFESVRVRGVESRSELVDLSNRVAREGHCAGLSFETGAIADAELERADLVIALHACDTATDDAIAKGIAAGASYIVVSPCCQKELRPQLVSPPVLAPSLRHGILKERHVEFVTDALRAGLLEWAGYETKVFEFISTEHTSRNIMITGAKRERAGAGEALAGNVRNLALFYGIKNQTLANRLGFQLNGFAHSVPNHD